jgi:hypothetical protein
MPLSHVTPTGPLHDCLEVTDLIRSDKTDDPLVTPDDELLNDGSKFTKTRIRYAGAEVVSPHTLQGEPQLSELSF